MEITYTKTGDVLLPNLSNPEVKPTFGKYGQMRLQFLKEHKKGLFTSMILNGTLTEHLNGIDEQAREYIQQFIECKSAEECIEEKLKAQDQIAWVGAMNAIKNQAEERVIKEMIYG